MPLPFAPPQVSHGLPSSPQLDWRGIFSVMDSPFTDPELHDWLRWASESGKTSMFVRRVAIALHRTRRSCMSSSPTAADSGLDSHGAHGRRCRLA